MWKKTKQISLGVCSSNWSPNLDVVAVRKIMWTCQREDIAVPVNLKVGVKENKTHKILWEFGLQTDPPNLDFVAVSKWMRSCQKGDIALPVNYRRQ